MISRNSLSGAPPADGKMSDRLYYPLSKGPNVRWRTESQPHRLAPLSCQPVHISQEICWFLRGTLRSIPNPKQANLQLMFVTPVCQAKTSQTSRISCAFASRGGTHTPAFLLGVPHPPSVDDIPESSQRQWNICVQTCSYGLGPRTLGKSTRHPSQIGSLHLNHQRFFHPPVFCGSTTLWWNGDGQCMIRLASDHMGRRSRHCSGTLHVGTCMPFLSGAHGAGRSLDRI